MRWILGVAILLVTLGVHACRVDVDAVDRPAAGDYEWVRTSDGWERRSNWLPPTTLYQPALHPLVVACGEVLLSIAAIVVLSPERRRPPRRFSANRRP